MKAFIVGAARTPITQFKTGALANVPATQLGAFAIKGALSRAKISGEHVQEVFMGQVCQAGAGQAPARQAALGAGLPESVICSTVNKVCASGMKAIMFATQSIRLGDNDVVIAGGMESMSLVPRYLERSPKPLGNLGILDGIMNDGLTDAYGKYLMGVCGENTCKNLGISREQQDNFAISSYTKSASAHNAGKFASEIVPVELKNREIKTLVDSDEEFRRIDFSKVPTLKPAFEKNGTITAANASTLNDGAAATVIMSSRAVDTHKVEPIAEVYAYSDAACKPIDFPIAPALSIPKALEAAKLNVSDISRWEINEAFSAVVLANIKLLQLNPELVNMNGGAVSLGHPIGMSGARIVNSLVFHLEQGQFGVASICNGGGGASTIIIKKL